MATVTSNPLRPKSKAQVPDGGGVAALGAPADGGDAAPRPALGATGELLRVTGTSLESALKRARALHGADAGVVESRSVWQRDPDGLGRTRLVEVLVAPAGTTPGLARRAAPARAPRATNPEPTAALSEEVSRIEQLVASLGEARGIHGADTGLLADYPLGEALLRAGASRPAVQRLAGLYRDHPAGGRGSRDAALAHLRTHLRTSGSDWAACGGCHVFLGWPAVGKSNLVLGLAARLRAAGKRTLVLSLFPRHGGEIRRLQLEAARLGCDAAVMHRADQLIRNAAQLAGYAAVLIDTPDLSSAPFAPGGELHAFISQNESLHRHLVVPLDADLREQAGLWEAARLWNCDWTALTRLDRTRLPGKLLDLLSRVSYPLSLFARGPWPEREPELARPDELVAWLLGGASATRAAAASA